MQIAYIQGPYSPSALTPSGRVLLAAMRHARAGAAATLACFVEACGETRGRPCFVVFLQIVHGLALYGRRRMRVGSDKWPILTHDEVALLRCVDAGIRGGEAALAAHVAWLVRGYGTNEFAAYIRTLASLMPETMFRDAEAEAPAAPGLRASARLRPFRSRSNNREASAGGYFRLRSHSLKIFSQTCSDAPGE